MENNFLSDNLRTLCNKKNIEGGCDFAVVMDKEKSKVFNGLENIPLTTIIEMGAYKTDNNCRLYTLDEFINLVKSGLDTSKVEIRKITIPQYDRLVSFENFFQNNGTTMTRLNSIDRVDFRVSQNAWSMQFTISFKVYGVDAIHFQSEKLLVDNNDNTWGMRQYQRMYNIYHRFYNCIDSIAQEYLEESHPFFDVLSLDTMEAL